MGCIQCANDYMNVWTSGTRMDFDDVIFGFWVPMTWFLDTWFPPPSHSPAKKRTLLSLHLIISHFIVFYFILFNHNKVLVKFWSLIWIIIKAFKENLINRLSSKWTTFHLIFIHFLFTFKFAKRCHRKEFIHKTVICLYGWGTYEYITIYYYFIIFLFLYSLYSFILILLLNATNVLLFSYILVFFLYSYTLLSLKLFYS